MLYMVCLFAVENQPTNQRINLRGNGRISWHAIFHLVYAPTPFITYYSLYPWAGDNMQILDYEPAHINSSSWFNCNQQNIIIGHYAGNNHIN